MLRLAALLVFVAVAAAQNPEPCKNPLVWEARMSEYDHGTGTNIRFRISYDSVNLRRRILETVDPNQPGRR